MRRRLVLVVAATTALVVVAFAVPLAALVRNVARDRAITTAERDATALAPVLAATSDPELIAAAVELTSTGADGRLSVFAGARQIGDPAPTDPQALALAGDRGAGFTRDTSGGVELYSPVVTADGQVSVVRARVPDGLLDDGVATAWLALGGVGVVLVVAGSLLADQLARSLTRDAADLADTARALATGAGDARARPGGVAEIAEVGRALNALADRIDELRAAERERVADLSHRLRTPLAALRLEADRSGVRTLGDGVDRLELAVTQLIRDARRPLRPGLTGATCDLTGVVAERVRFWQALADDDGRPATSRLPADPLVVGLQAEEAAAALDALLDNVFTHTPDGTPYAVLLDHADGRAHLTVSDDGPGVPDATAVAGRGHSGEGSTGLGLDIVHGAAATGGGTVTIRSRPGAGFAVTVDLPLAGPPGRSSAAASHPTAPQVRRDTPPARWP